MLLVRLSYQFLYAKLCGWVKTYFSAYFCLMGYRIYKKEREREPREDDKHQFEILVRDRAHRLNWFSFKEEDKNTGLKDNSSYFSYYSKLNAKSKRLSSCVATFSSSSIGSTLSHPQPSGQIISAPPPHRDARANFVHIKVLYTNLQF